MLKSEYIDIVNLDDVEKINQLVDLLDFYCQKYHLPFGIGPLSKNYHGIP
jgi:hypothetical protein